ncbi:MAG: DMT family transporter [Ignavibacteria bacterium]|nr:DMT family transporter [Ignavibacteria bacterium]
MREKFKNNHTFLAWVLLIILTFVWGSSYILMKIGLKAYPPDELGSARIAITFVVLLPLAIKNMKAIPREKLGYVFIVGLLGNLIPAYLFALAQTNLESSLTGIINALTPVFTVIVAYFYLKNKITLIQLAGLVLGILGCAGISMVNSQDGGFGRINLYAWLVVLATILYAVAVNIIKLHFQNVGTIALSSLSIFFVGPFALIYVLTTDFIPRSLSFTQSGESLIAIIVLSVIGTAFAIILYNKVIQIKGPVFASTVTFMMPLVSIFWGLLDGEKLFLLHYAGLALTFAGVYLTNRKI